MAEQLLHANEVRAAAVEPRGEGMPEHMPAAILQPSLRHALCSPSERSFPKAAGLGVVKDAIEPADSIRAPDNGKGLVIERDFEHPAVLFDPEIYGRCVEIARQASAESRFPARAFSKMNGLINGARPTTSLLAPGGQEAGLRERTPAPRACPSVFQAQRPSKSAPAPLQGAS